MSAWIAASDSASKSEKAGVSRLMNAITSKPSTASWRSTMRGEMRAVEMRAAGLVAMAMGSTSRAPT